MTADAPLARNFTATEHVREFFSLKPTETSLAMIKDPESYKAEKVIVTVAGLAIAGSVLALVAVKVLLPTFGVHIGNIGGFHLTPLLYGMGAAGALTGATLIGRSWIRVEAHKSEIGGHVMGNEHLRQKAILFFGAMTVIGLPLAIAYHKELAVRE